MKILLVHNYYRQRGGEDVVFEMEARLLQQAGFSVDTYIVENDTIEGLASTAMSALAVYGISEHRRRLVQRVMQTRPDIVHFHNVFPLISTSAFSSVRAHNCAVVHTIHNYRPVCAAGTFFRDGQVCELCLHARSYHAVLHRCYRGSRLGSAVLAGSIARDLSRGTWRDLDVIIALTQFAKDKLISAGLPSDKLVVKGNSTVDPGPPDPRKKRRGLLYVGRLSPEKGVDTLLKAAEKIGEKITICGQGPDGDRLRALAGDNVSFVGTQPHAAVQQLMGGAMALVIPSLWYEGFPMTAIEALAHGTPIIASNIGSLAEIIHRSGGGLTFEPGNSNELAASAQIAIADPLCPRSPSARAAYVMQFSETKNIDSLRDIYVEAIQRRRLAVEY